MNSMLGFLMLVGTVVNNGILYVDTVNQLRMEMPLDEALVEAGAIRVRPICMTTLTTIIAMIPNCLAWQGGQDDAGLSPCKRRRSGCGDDPDAGTASILLPGGL